MQLQEHEMIQQYLCNEMYLFDLYIFEDQLTPRLVDSGSKLVICDSLMPISIIYS